MSNIKTTDTTVHDYEVIVTGPEVDPIVIDVRLTFDAADQVHHLSQRASDEAMKRAVRLAKRDFAALIGEHEVNAVDVECIGSAFVQAGRRPRKRI